MKVFLSWSGTTSQKLGLILRDWLPLVLPYVKPYISSEDIDKGVKWLPDIVDELQSSYYGIILLTQDNLNAPWLVFEAGVLMKSLKQSRVSPLLFDLKPTDFSGPLTQFQCTQTDQEDFRKLLRSINNAANDRDRIESGNLDRIFEKWWGELEQQFQELRKESDSIDPAVKVPQTREQEMIEELLSLTRNLQGLLRTPEMILPEYYLESILRHQISSSVEDTAKILKAVSQLTHNYKKLEQKLSDYKSRVMRDSYAKELVPLIYALRKPVETLSHIEVQD